MKSVYRGAVLSLVFAVLTVASLMWKVRQDDLGLLATKADAAAINAEIKTELLKQEEIRTQRYWALAKKLDTVRSEVKQNTRILGKTK